MPVNCKCICEGAISRNSQQKLEARTLRGGSKMQPGFAERQRFIHVGEYKDVYAHQKTLLAQGH